MNLFNRGNSQAQAKTKTYNDTEKDIILFEREEKLKIKENLFTEKENNFEMIRDLNNKLVLQEIDELEKYYSAKESREKELVMLESRIISKKELFNSLEDSKNKEIKLLNESNLIIIANYKEMIELLKTQVEVLTAKLTELKITDAHVHVDAKMTKE